ncbi:Fe(3+) ABC transporter substrate-binding protein [Terasakiella sp. SH-1]|uniref:Fe(3+) ABC transporter substrate-binding protein n=1 Tax=Terasakiella sp. SH-1 TaxID=2560057 RepID=UPI0010746DC2|nr:Fe(3+) ABC transporter substrate-binding protein [Terasakiella sp. SH-1]
MSFKKITGMALGAFCVTMAASAQAEEVNLYSSRQPFLINPLLEAFTEETGVKVNMVYIKKGMLERIKAEGENSPADLILTSDIGKLDNHVQAGLLKATSSDVLKEKIPSQYRHPDGLWYGLTTRARIIYAHNKRVKPEEVQTYEDLAKPHMEGRVCTRSGKHEYNVSLLASIVAAKGEEYALEWAKGLKKNLARKPQGNDRAQVKAVYQGECDVSLGNTYYMGKMVTNEKNPEQKDWAASVFLVFPNQADRGTHVNISGGGVLKGAMNEANAIKLLEFLTGPKAQALYAEGNFEYPIDENAKLHPVVASWGKFKADEMDLTKIAEYRKIATRIMDKVRYNN